MSHRKGSIGEEQQDYFDITKFHLLNYRNKKLTNFFLFHRYFNNEFFYSYRI